MRVKQRVLILLNFLVLFRLYTRIFLVKQASIKIKTVSLLAIRGANCLPYTGSYLRI